MSNPLVDLQKLIGKDTQKTFTARVVGVSGQKVKITLSAGNSMVVWGTAKLNDTVLILGKQIVAVVSGQTRTTVYVP